MRHENPCWACFGIKAPDLEMKVRWLGCEKSNAHDGPHRHEQSGWEWTDNHPDADQYVATGPSYDARPCH
jgi:hypothetical protein